MALELRPAHDPRKAYGFVGVVISLEGSLVVASGCGIWTAPNGKGRHAASGR